MCWIDLSPNSTTSALEVNFNVMRYTNSRLTSLLAYLLHFVVDGLGNKSHKTTREIYNYSCTEFLIRGNEGISITKIFLH